MNAPVQPAQRPQCSIIVPTWRRASVLKSTLSAIENQSYENIEVLVVCDGDDPETLSLSQSFCMKRPLRWVFHAENRGLPSARNTGAREAAGEIILFLDDDVLPDPELVEAHVGHHLAEGLEHRVAVGSLTLEQRLTPLNSFVDICMEEAWKQSMERWAKCLSAQGIDSVGDDVQAILWFGLNSSIRRDVFLSSGGYNEAFRASDEEIELGMRLHLAGVEHVFEPRTLLTHLNSKSPAGYFRRCWRASGALDPYRVIELMQCNAQTRRIASRDHGYLFQRIAARTASSLSRPLLAFARLLEIAANRTRSRSLFSVWARTAHAAEYWEGAKRSGYTRDQIGIAAKASRNALMMHSICEPRTATESTYYISPARFRRFMKRFGEAGYRTATSAEWMERDFSSHSVLLTFDDAYDDLYSELFPVVIDRGYTPLIFVVVGQIGGSNTWDRARGLRPRNLLSANQIKEMQRYGVEFGSHTLTHPDLIRLGHRELIRELRDSKDRLENLLGVEVNAFAYPYGAVDRRVRSYVAEAGYKLAFTTAAGPNRWNDPLCQNRAEVNDLMNLIDFSSVISTGWTVRQNIGDRLRMLEQHLPGSTLRASMRLMRTIARALRPVPR
ncbi:MAG TPA: polysaccharide deacetylase family protein [Terriglobales bacterium]|nr:polysaccharide deacetylase family protein [Terriglobales bacterium]